MEGILSVFTQIPPIRFPTSILAMSHLPKIEVGGIAAFNSVCFHPLLISKLWRVLTFQAAPALGGQTAVHFSNPLIYSSGVRMTIRVAIDSKDVVYVPSALSFRPLPVSLFVSY